MSNLSVGERFVRATWRLAPKRLLSRMIGWGARRELPRPLEPSPAVVRPRVSAGHQRGRTLQRPLPEPPSLLHPTLGRRCAASAVDPDELVARPTERSARRARPRTASCSKRRVRSSPLRDLLADDDLATALTGGPYLVVYLSPRDYHRVHFPSAVGSSAGLMCRVRSSGWQPERPAGTRAVRQERALRHGPRRPRGPLRRGDGRRRGCRTHHRELRRRGRHPRERVRRGRCPPQDFTSPPTVERGDELGIFNLGSTTVTIFEPGRVHLRELLSKHSNQDGSCRLAASYTIGPEPAVAAHERQVQHAPLHPTRGSKERATAREASSQPGPKLRPSMTPR